MGQNKEIANRSPMAPHRYPSSVVSSFRYRRIAKGRQELTKRESFHSLPVGFAFAREVNRVSSGPLSLSRSPRLDLRWRRKRNAISMIDDPNHGRERELGGEYQPAGNRPGGGLLFAIAMASREDLLRCRHCCKLNEACEML